MSEHSFKIVTLGCKVNQYEGQALRQGLLDAGLSEDAAGAQPTVVVVNSCCVTAEAARQSRQAARKALRDSGSPRVYVTGCYAHRAACDAALGAIEGLAGIEADKSALLQSIAAETACAVAAAEAQPITEFGGHTRAFVKVQDGCDAACSYCIVWRVRPDLRSKLPEDVAEEVRRLSQKHREIVICGIHLGKYGVDLDGRVDLAGLVAALLDVPEVGRIRLSSIEPLEVTDGLLDLIADNPERASPHLHLPLQSGDDGVLERMRRPYRAADYLRIVERARGRVDGLSITTDVMVGFPGETDGAFEGTLRLCRSVGFSKVHIFPFSARPGTPAAEMDAKVPAEVIKSRCRSLAEVAGESARRYRASLIGTRARIVVETVRDDLAQGLSERYVRVTAPAGPGIRRGQFLDIRLAEVTAEGMAGESLARARV